ncbi:MAG: class I SAM-dependent methyltransferase [Bacteroidetes bacterium]|nr:class I SAM-dependent methyltransferase [Bacteroidota bacterium]
MEKLDTCLVCGHNKFRTLFSCKDFVATGDNFQLEYCEQCSFLYTNPRPTISEIGKYYQSDQYISHAGEKKGLIYKLYDIVRDFSIKQKLSLIKKYHSNGKLMDLGCGLGYFLNGVKLDKTFDTLGVDVSDDAVEFVKKTFGLDVKNESELDNLEKHSFDIITQWHVLEHVHFLKERMLQLHHLLKEEGTMFIAVPNSKSKDAEMYKEFWDGYDVPRHLYHFNQKSFSLLMEKHGFEIIEIKPMWFDAPYISMRSEVHMKNKYPFINGALSGIRSTATALSTGEHSTLLYVVKKKK